MDQGQANGWRRGLRLLAMVPALLVASALGSAAMTPSCQKDFETHSKAREGAVQRINSFNKKRPTATQACGAFNNLTSVENKMLKWMTDNQAWCQIPDDFLGQFKEATAKTVQVRGNVCTAAKKEQQARAQQQGAAPRGPAPGAGVRLPQGAL